MCSLPRHGAESTAGAAEFGEALKRGDPTVTAPLVQAGTLRSSCLRLASPWHERDCSHYAPISSNFTTSGVNGSTTSALASARPYRLVVLVLPWTQAWVLDSGERRRRGAASMRGSFRCRALLLMQSFANAQLTPRTAYHQRRLADRDLRFLRKTEAEALAVYEGGSTVGGRVSAIHFVVATAISSPQ